MKHIKTIIAAAKCIDALNKHLIQKHNIKWHSDDDAPESFKDLQLAMVFSDSIPVSPHGCHNTIYGSKEANQRFRAVHDWLHLKLNVGFDFLSEIDVANAHLTHLTDRQIELTGGVGISDKRWYNAYRVLKIDTAGQTLYYHKHKKFVDSQMLFCNDMLKHWDKTGKFELIKGDY